MLPCPLVVSSEQCRGANHDSITPRTSLLKASLSSVRTDAGNTSKRPGVLLGTISWKGGGTVVRGLVSPQGQ